MPDMTESTDQQSSPTLAGNVPDPDARTIDSLVEQHAQPPEPDLLPKDDAPTLVRPVTGSRLLSGTQPLQVAWGPVLLLAADADRSALTLRAISATATDAVLLADDPGKLFASGALTITVGDVVPLNGHTGPVWVAAAPTAVGPLSITYGAVTK